MAPIEQSFIAPGDFVIGCDSHTTTPGGIGAHSMGVGSSEGAHQVATGALPLNKLKTMRINITIFTKLGIFQDDRILPNFTQFTKVVFSSVDLCKPNHSYIWSSSILLAIRILPSIFLGIHS